MKTYLFRACAFLMCESLALSGAFELDLVNDGSSNVSIMTSSNQCFDVSIPSVYALSSKTFAKVQITPKLSWSCAMMTSSWHFRVDTGTTYQDYEIFDDHQGKRTSQGIRYSSGFVEYVNSDNAILYVTASLNQNRFVNIVAYNIDQNGTGGDGWREQGLAPQINAIKTLTPKADIVALIEVKQNCAASGYVDGVAVFATQLNMNYVVGPEYKELGTTHTCVTDNAALSRYPIDYIGTYTFQKQCCTIGGRSGGRGMVIGHVNKKWFGSRKGLYVIATHLEAGLGSLSGLVDGFETRLAQAQEIAAYINKNIVPNQDDVVVLGDFNAPNLNFSWFDFGHPIRELAKMGLNDALILVDHQFSTVPDNEISKFALKNGYSYQLDYILVKGANTRTNQVQVVNTNQTFGYSDHLPVSATLVLEPDLTGFTQAP